VACFKVLCRRSFERLRKVTKYLRIVGPRDDIRTRTGHGTLESDVPVDPVTLLEAGRSRVTVFSENIVS
jgi:hypothetical protein